MGFASTARSTISIRRVGVALAVICAVILAGCADPTRPAAAGPATACPTSAVSGRPTRPDPSRPGTVWQLRDLEPSGGDTGPHPPRVEVPHAPYAVPGLTDVIDVASTASTYFAVRADGTVWVWGLDAVGLFGRSTARGYSYTPVQVPGVSGARWIHAVGFTVFVGRVDGSVIAWGDEALLLRPGLPRSGFQGVATPVSITVPGQVAPLGGGDLTAIATTADGRVWLWGSEIPSYEVKTPAASQPISVAGLGDIVEVAAGLDTAYALRADGVVCSWGMNFVGQLGSGTIGPEGASPALVGGLPPIEQIAAGPQTGYALDRTGSVWAWGGSGQGALGAGSARENQPTAKVVAGLPKISAISAFGLTAFAVSADGRLFGWGSAFSLPVDDRFLVDGVSKPVEIPIGGTVQRVDGALVLVNGAAPAAS